MIITLLPDRPTCLSIRPRFLDKGIFGFEMGKTSAMSRMHIFSIIFLVQVLLYTPTHTYDVDGCPMAGCCPRQTQRSSMTLFPSKNATLRWRHHGRAAAGPVALGCVVNSKQVVCPDGESFVVLDPLTGDVKWTDNVLTNPTLPIMDVRGDVVSTDGNSFLEYLSDGTLQPVRAIKPSLCPVYSMTASDNGILLITSQTAELVAYTGDGVAFASIILHGTMGAVNGRYAPVAVPALNQNNRAFYLTAFLPGNGTQLTNLTRTMFRLYAIDVRAVMVGRLKVIWHLDLAPALLNLNSGQLPLHAGSVLVYGSKVTVGLRLPSSTPIMLWVIEDAGDHGVIKCNLPSFPIVNLAKDTDDLWQGKRRRNKRESSLDFMNARRTPPEVKTMNQRPYHDDVRSNDGDVFILTSDNSVINRLSPKTCKVDVIFDPKDYSSLAQITSKVSIISADDKSTSTILVFGVSSVEGFSISKRGPNNVESFGMPPIPMNGVVAMELTQGSSRAEVLWALPVAGNHTVMGQIGGITVTSGSRGDSVNLLVAYAQNATHSLVLPIQA